MQKPSLPKGTRDFSPQKMVRRYFIFDTIKKVFQKYGFQPLETPSMENLSVLTGKYGDEGDQLIFKILNSGDFLSEVDASSLSEGYKSVTRKISEKALRYDLTVPFARYVVMNRNEVTFPFKRYQIQPVWRADRPQKGRYREFYQCDADVVGTDSLLCEAEIIMMMHEALRNLGIQQFEIKINNRKILSGIAQIIGAASSEQDLFVAIDKLDKVGLDKVLEELKEKGFEQVSLELLSSVLTLKGSFDSVIEELKKLLSNSEVGLLGISELEQIRVYAQQLGLEDSRVALDPTLARGLSYYTGAIFEVKALGVQMGSISGGGRYDNLTGLFGMPGVSGVGFSFGVDRIYDVMDELALFPENVLTTTQVLVCTFDENLFRYGLEIASSIRAKGISCEIYPDSAKMKKQMSYADDKSIPYVVIIGSEEMETNTYMLKDMRSGEQNRLDKSKLLELLVH